MRLFWSSATRRICSGGTCETSRTLLTSWVAATQRSGSTFRPGMRCTSIEGINPTSIEPWPSRRATTDGGW